MNKPTIKRNVAEAIERYLNEFDKKTLLKEHADADGVEVTWVDEYKALYDIDFDTLLLALANGYEIEKTPEQKIADLYSYHESAAEILGKYDDAHDRGVMHGISKVADILGITIEGVNA